MRDKKRKKNKTIYLKHETRRMSIILTVILAFFVCIVFRIFYLNVFMGNFYDMKLSNSKDTYVYGESVPRGRILDRNGKVLVGNKAVKSIYYKKYKNVTQEKEVNSAYKIAKFLKLDYSQLLDRNKREFFVILNRDYTDKLITSDEYDKLSNRKLSEDDIYELKIKRIKKSDLTKMTSLDNKAAYIYYLMNKGYFYDEKEIKSLNVSDKEYAYFSENSKSLKGFNTKLEWERTYPYGDTLEAILGSVSSRQSGIPKDSLNDYLDNGYSLTDRVGISGLEKYYENILRGDKAVYKLDGDDNLVLVKEGKKGTDIMLSIDIDLQRKIDKMLSKEIVKAKSEANTQYFNRSYLNKSFI